MDFGTRVDPAAGPSSPPAAAWAAESGGAPFPATDGGACGPFGDVGGAGTCGDGVPALPDGGFAPPGRGRLRRERLQRRDCWEATAGVAAALPAGPYAPILAMTKCCWPMDHRLVVNQYNSTPIGKLNPANKKLKGRTYNRIFC